MTQEIEEKRKIKWTRRSWRRFLLVERSILRSIVALLLVYFLLVWIYYTNFNSGPRDCMAYPPLDESQNKLPRAEEIREDDVVRVLCVDGGGIKGLLPLHIIKSLEEKTGKPASELFDLMVGTSTGGIIVSSLAVPDSDGKSKWSADDLIHMYAKMVKTGQTVKKNSSTTITLKVDNVMVDRRTPVVFEPNIESLLLF